MSPVTFLSLLYSLDGYQVRVNTSLLHMQSRRMTRLWGETITAVTPKSVVRSDSYSLRYELTVVLIIYYLCPTVVFIWVVAVGGDAE